MSPNRLSSFPHTKYAMARFFLLLAMVACPYEYRIYDHMFRANDIIKRRTRQLKRSYSRAKAEERKKP